MLEFHHLINLSVFDMTMGSLQKMKVRKVVRIILREIHRGNATSVQNKPPYVLETPAYLE
jgi:hypothetical protein